jgi:Rrf2 family iron-sulfur cluster assembly transcriptional regulator
MKISRSTQYGLIALGYIAQHGKKGLVMSEAISKQYNIPLEYLLKILHQLVRGGVLRSKRGPRGGFSLAQKPEDINFLQIIEAIEGPLRSEMDLAEQTDNEPFSLRIEDLCKGVIQQVRDTYAAAKLADVLAA